MIGGTAPSLRTDILAQGRAHDLAIAGVHRDQPLAGPAASIGVGIVAVSAGGVAELGGALRRGLPIGTFGIINLICVVEATGTATWSASGDTGPGVVSFYLPASAYRMERPTSHVATPIARRNQTSRGSSEGIYSNDRTRHQS